MDPATFQAKIRKKKAFEGELARMSKPHTVAGFRRRSWLKHQVEVLEAELKQGDLALGVR